MAAKVVLITGVNGGLGSAVAAAFAQAGYKIVGSDVTKYIGSDLRFVPCDVREKAQIDALFADIMGHEGRLDAVVSVAGIFGPQVATANYPDEEWLNVINTNLTSSFRVLQNALKMMQPAKSGKIVLVSSTAGSVGITERSAYVASKHAINGLIKSAALENAKTGVQINGVAPGFLDCGMALQSSASNPAVMEYMKKQNPTGQLVAASDVASFILWLAETSTMAVSGQVFTIDQGYTLR